MNMAKTAASSVHGWDPKYTSAIWLKTLKDMAENREQMQ